MLVFVICRGHIRPNPLMPGLSRDYSVVLGRSLGADCLINNPGVGQGFLASRPNGNRAAEKNRKLSSCAKAELRSLASKVSNFISDPARRERAVTKFVAELLTCLVVTIKLFTGRPCTYPYMGQFVQLDA